MGTALCPSLPRGQPRDTVGFSGPCWLLPLPQAVLLWSGLGAQAAWRAGCLPSCLMPSLSSMSSCTRGMSMCRRGPCGGPFTGVSKLRLFLL